MLNWTGKSKVIIQGIVEPLGVYCAGQMTTYGTPIVAGISAGYGGETIEEIPVFDLIESAIAEVGMPQLSIIAVPPYWVLDAALEAMSAGIRQLIILPHGVPPLDMIRLLAKAKATNTIVLGAGSAGVIIPGKLLLGSCDPQCYTPGKIGVISRCDYVTDAIIWELTQAGLGQSIVIHLGGGDIIGSMVEGWLPTLEQDKNTEIILCLEQTLCGTEAMASVLSSPRKKPLVAHIAGQNVPIPSKSKESPTLIASRLSQLTPHTSTALAKKNAYQQAKIPVAQSPAQLVEYLRNL
ncbi:hypothetical protein K4A83_14555 [Spirulina subsalsa FACHB-351]|uniref:CoA-binding domain-containing protein n=1 Tax=Spirulina subsalsa FACHB-351 TaxID=234711 RepID=A0ABT3L7L4_9CYAN|nr:hypothetical protein [Spirulina subsalsa]MCW6037485.1 hypothetical protein [Spirulina subsalsa FACHB-351]